MLFCTLKVILTKLDKKPLVAKLLINTFVQKNLHMATIYIEQLLAFNLQRVKCLG